MKRVFYSLLFALCCLFGSTQASNDYDDIIREAAAIYGVPFAFIKSVIRQESAFNSNAESSVGAQGLMQLMPATASDLGVTDRLDPRDNIMGGTKYLSQLLDRYNGDPVLALAAYNAGLGNVDRYGGVPPFEETVNYITRISGFLSQYGAGSLNLAGLPVSFVTSPTGDNGGGVMGELESFPEFSVVLDRFESAVGISATSISSGITATISAIALIWMSWHLISLISGFKSGAVALSSVAVYAARGMVLLLVFFAFIRLS